MKPSQNFKIFHSNFLRKIQKNWPVYFWSNIHLLHTNIVVYQESIIKNEMRSIQSKRDSLSLLAADVFMLKEGRLNWSVHNYACHLTLKTFENSCTNEESIGWQYTPAYPPTMQWTMAVPSYRSAMFRSARATRFLSRREEPHSRAYLSQRNTLLSMNVRTNSRSVTESRNLTNGFVQISRLRCLPFNWTLFSVASDRQTGRGSGQLARYGLWFTREISYWKPSNQWFENILSL